MKLQPNEYVVDPAVLTSAITLRLLERNPTMSELEAYDVAIAMRLPYDVRDVFPEIADVRLMFTESHASAYPCRQMYLVEGFSIDSYVLNGINRKDSLNYRNKSVFLYDGQLGILYGYPCAFRYSHFKKRRDFLREFDARIASRLPLPILTETMLVNADRLLWPARHVMLPILTDIVTATGIASGNEDMVVHSLVPDVRGDSSPKSCTVTIRARDGEEKDISDEEYDRVALVYEFLARFLRANCPIGYNLNALQKDPDYPLIPDGFTFEPLEIQYPLAEVSRRDRMAAMNRLRTALTTEQFSELFD